MEFSGSLNLDTLALVGITLVVASIVGQTFRRLNIPQVVGFIVAGTLLGPSFLNVIPRDLTDGLVFVSEVALGLIGFEMGEHLRFGELRHLGRSIGIIVVLQALGAFVLVTAGVYLVTHSTATAIVFGSIAMATAPAATVDVLTEYGAEGPMTTTLLAVIGIDDALTLIVFSIAAALAEPLISTGGLSIGDLLTGHGDVSLIDMIELPILEIGGSLAIGILFGIFLSRTMDYIGRYHAPTRRQHDAMAFSIAVIFIATGLSHSMDLSLILTTMIMGTFVVNRNPLNGAYIRFTIEHAGPVIYVLFFALVGAGLDVSLLPDMGLLGVLYIVLRITGKYVGAWLGGHIAGAGPLVRNNLGLALLSQAGVAIGLALTCETRFASLGERGEELGVLVLNVVTATTFVVQLVGPILVKVAITRAGEIGRAREDGVEFVAVEPELT